MQREENNIYHDDYLCGSGGGLFGERDRQDIAFSSGLFAWEGHGSGCECQNGYQATEYIYPRSNIY